jgi:hypothetical protein
MEKTLRGNAWSILTDNKVFDSILGAVTGKSDSSGGANALIDKLTPEGKVDPTADCQQANLQINF